jgi:hypothetical protein
MGVVGGLPEDLQWTIRMLLPKPPPCALIAATTCDRSNVSLRTFPVAGSQLHIMNRVWQTVPAAGAGMFIAGTCTRLCMTRELPRACSVPTGAGNASAVTRHGSVSRPLALPLNRAASASAPTLGGAASAGGSMCTYCVQYPSQ